MKPKIEVIVVVSDLHCGSVVGLAPPESKTKTGNIVSFGENEIQEWLWSMWLEGIKRTLKLVGKSPFGLVVNGDATEGSHHRNSPDLLMDDIECHVRMAEECLQPFASKAAKTYIVKGTECHTLEMESLLANRLKAEGGEARDKWLVKMNGVLYDIAHHMSTTGRAYLEASAMGILMGNARQNYLRAGQRVPQVYVRGHRHCGGHYSDGQGIFSVTGAWQMLTRHGHKVVTDSLPRPSITIFDARNQSPGELPMVREIFFDPPQHEIETI